LFPALNVGPATHDDPDVNISEQGGWSKIHDAHGSLTIGALSPSIVYMQLTGKILGSFFPPVVPIVDVLLIPGQKLTFFVDGEAWTGYEPAYRDAITGWFKTHPNVIAKVHILVDSALVRMGIQVVNLGIGNLLKASAHRAPFEVELAKNVPNFYSHFKQRGRLLAI
jgi:hypothetical protein